jgi:hypothetical protein
MRVVPGEQRGSDFARGRCRLHGAAMAWVGGNDEASLAYNTPPRRARASNGAKVRAVSELLPDVGRASFRKFGFVQHRRSSAAGRDRRRALCPRLRARIDPLPAGQARRRRADLIVSRRARADDAACRPRDHRAGQSLLRLYRRRARHDPPGRGQASEKVDRPPPSHAAPLSAELGDSLREVVDPELQGRA